ncbi:hypothetical protein [Corynebacterium sanguinis]|uniref:hypothetical protein n=1 Tax=Corynebacterium sanguinis TaxID=2594913 RepID=UPI00223C3D30|nr:hypothetical protein [Corynebacterium sanguinis]MCT2155034.1 hypothetical protein [Corynebacterium sanguinis]
MNDSKRIVSVFMAVGLALAIGVGVVVWKMSSPSTAANPAYLADATEPASSEPTSQPVMRSAASPEPTAPADRDRTAPTQGDADPAAAERDPLLPPNAVVNPAPRAATPTRVYRPSNVVPTSVIAPQGDALSTDLTPVRPTGQSIEPTPATPADATPETTAPTAPPATSETDTTGTTAPETSAAESTQVQNPANTAPVTSAPATRPVTPQQLPDPIEQALPTSTDPTNLWERLQRVFQ